MELNYKYIDVYDLSSQSKTYIIRTGSTSMPHHELNGINVYYQSFHAKNKSSTAETVVLVHGLGLDSSLWERILPYFQEMYHVVTFDLRGHGNSDEGDRPLSWELFCNDVLALIQHLNIKGLHLVGHSYGANIAVKFSLLYPELVRSITLIAIPSVLPQPVLERAIHYRRALSGGTSLAPIAKELIKLITLEPDNSTEVHKIYRSYERLRLDFYFAALDIYQNDRVLNDLSKLEIPSLFLAGEHDAIYSPGLIGFSSTHVKQSKFFVIPESSNLTFVDQPQTTYRFIERFIQTLEHLKPVEHSFWENMESTVQTIFSAGETQFQAKTVLKVDLLRSFRVAVDGRTIVEGWNRRYAKNLLLYLVFHPTSTREQLCDDLFPDLEFRKASNNLKVYLNYLKNQLGGSPPLLKLDREHVSLDCEIQCDVKTFVEMTNRAIHEPDADRKSKLCAGLFQSLPNTPLLQGFYDDWSLRLREKLEDQVAALAKWMADDYTKRQDHAAAVNYLKIAMQFDPEGESVKERDHAPVHSVTAVKPSYVGK